MVFFYGKTFDFFHLNDSVLSLKNWKLEVSDFEPNYFPSNISDLVGKLFFQHLAFLHQIWQLHEE